MPATGFVARTLSVDQGSLPGPGRTNQLSCFTARSNLACLLRCKWHFRFSWTWRLPCQPLSPPARSERFRHGSGIQISSSDQFVRGAILRDFLNPKPMNSRYIAMRFLQQQISEVLYRPRLISMRIFHLRHHYAKAHFVSHSWLCRPGCFKSVAAVSHT